MTIYVCNAFSLSMLDRETQVYRPKTPRPIWDLIAWLAQRQSEQFVSAIGHADTAALYSRILGVELAPNRINIKLAPGDELLVGQYVGPRLPEGATTLPPGATIEWWQV